MDDTFRRQWAIQVARERADEARDLHRRSIDEEADRRSLEHSRWLGLQVRAPAHHRAHRWQRPKRRTSCSLTSNRRVRRT